MSDIYLVSLSSVPLQFCTFISCLVYNISQVPSLPIIEVSLIHPTLHSNRKTIHRYVMLIVSELSSHCCISLEPESPLVLQHCIIHIRFRLGRYQHRLLVHGFTRTVRICFNTCHGIGSNMMTSVAANMVLLLLWFVC